MHLFGLIFQKIVVRTHSFGEAHVTEAAVQRETRMQIILVLVILHEDAHHRDVNQGQEQEQRKQPLQERVVRADARAELSQGILRILHSIQQLLMFQFIFRSSLRFLLFFLFLLL